MKLLDSIIVPSVSEEKRIDLCQGDLTSLEPEEAVDVLVISAFPNDYTPTPASLIGALHRKGISVSSLAKKKASDLREAFSCWLSQEIVSPDPGIQFKRILCFEPQVKGKPPEVVGDIFRSLAPFIAEEDPINTVAMPIVSAGDQNVSVHDILFPLLEAAVHWMEIGLPLNCLRIVTRSERQAKNAKSVFEKHFLMKKGCRGHQR
jgi:hypothetical protein